MMIVSGTSEVGARAGGMGGIGITKPTSPTESEIREISEYLGVPVKALKDSYTSLNEARIFDYVLRSACNIRDTLTSFFERAESRREREVAVRFHGGLKTALSVIGMVIQEKTQNSVCADLRKAREDMKEGYRILGSNDNLFYKDLDELIANVFVIWQKGSIEDRKELCAKLVQYKI